MSEPRPYSTEPERAVRATLLGVALGLMLVLLARARRGYPEK
jgi:hypothetical protein